MKGLLTSLVLAAVLAAALLLTAGAAAAVDCGGGVTVKGGTACWKAKAIVKEFKNRQKTHVQGFDCGGRKSGGKWVEVTCTLDNKRIHWEA
jgi:opacity protein-like surface antigen